MSSWPTPLRPDGSAPTSIELLASNEPELVRQALYQVQAAEMLIARGQSVRALQAPLICERQRICIPIVLARADSPDACGYTQCEPWTPERIAALQAWIRDLREESDSQVIVVSREVSSTVPKLTDVADFIHFPYDRFRS